MNFALNIRAADNGFTVETVGGDQDTLTVFPTYRAAFDFCVASLAMHGTLHGDSIKTIEQNATATLTTPPDGLKRK